MQQDFNLILGPLLGFLFTAGTLLFVALNAHRTVAAVPATATEPTAATTTATAEPVTPVEPAPATPAEAPAPESTREGT
ncbi:MAG: hypothetical protein ACK46X_06975 [Candidatus Sericytochromatia bacterium]